MPRQIVPVSDVASILLTQDEGDLRYLPITYTPPPVDLSVYYTKVQSDARYEPIDTMYTKAESDAKYSLTSHLHTGVYQPVGSYALTSHDHAATYVDVVGDTMTGALTINRGAGEQKDLILTGTSGDVSISYRPTNPVWDGQTGQLTPTLQFDSPAVWSKGGPLWIGQSGNGTGGHVRYKSDDGKDRWYAGLPGNAGALDFIVYSLDPSGQAFNARVGISATTGTTTLTPASGQDALYAAAPIRGRGPVGNIGDKTMSSYKFYDYSADNWAGFGCDVNGSVWLRYGGGAPGYTTTWNVSNGELTTLRVVATNLRCVSAGGTYGVTWVAPAGTGVEHYLSMDFVGPILRFTNTYLNPGADNSLYLGTANPAQRWIAVYAVNGTIQTSSATMKKNLKPLDPVACAAAVLETDWLSYEYLPPPPPERKEGEDSKERMAALNEYVATQAETAYIRKQNGYVLGHPTHKTHDLFGLADRQSASPSADLGILACALQAALQRIAALESLQGVTA